MEREGILKKLNEVFCDVFDDDRIIITGEMTANDIEAWDSLMHITLISAVENEFRIKFSMKEIVGMKNVGEMIDIIARETI